MIGSGLIDPTGQPNQLPLTVFRCPNPACGLTVSAPSNPGRCYECGSEYESTEPPPHVWQAPEDYGLPKTHWWNDTPWPKAFLAAFPMHFEGIGDDASDPD